MVLITHTKLSVSEPNFLKKKRGPKIGFLRVIEIYVYLSIYLRSKYNITFKKTSGRI